MKLELVRGMRDIIGYEALAQREFEKRAADFLAGVGYEEVKLPSIEYYDLIAAKAGQELLDSLYEFEDKAGRKVALTPELTASATRLYLTKFRNAPKPVKLWYTGSCFRYDEPQRGRYRQFTQLGVEVFGSSSPLADSEVAFVAANLLKKIGINATVKVGNISFIRSLLADSGLFGEKLLLAIREVDHANYEAVKSMLNPKGKAIIDQLMGEKKSDLNYWETLSSTEIPSAVPGIRRLKRVIELLKIMLPDTKINVDLSFARGLAYYTDFIFEAFSEGVNEALLGGGRYDELVAELGGPPTPAVGFAIGVDRIALLVKDLNIKKKALIVPLDDASLDKAALTFSRLSQDGDGFELMPIPLSVREAIERALKSSYDTVILAGSREGPNEVVVKNLVSRSQSVLAIDDIKEVFASSR
ncbi:MAG: histidine--tRNA ligase [Thermoprotei archaeon]